MEMKSQVKDFNWEIDLFLRSLARFRTTVNKADSNTIQLLADTLSAIDAFISSNDGVVEQNEKSEMFTIDDDKFEISRSITCRICCLQIPLARAEYLHHISSDYHNANLIRQTKTSDRGPVVQSNQKGVVNGQSQQNNGVRAVKPNTGKNVEASWRDRGQVRSSAPMPTPTNGPMQYRMQTQPNWNPENIGLVNQNVGPNPYHPHPYHPTPMNCAQYPIQYTRPVNSFNPLSPFPMSKAAPFQMNLPVFPAVPQTDVHTVEPLATKNVIEPESKQKARAEPTVPAPQKLLTPALPEKAAAAATPCEPPNVFDEDIFEFLDAQGSAEGTDSVKPAVESPAPPKVAEPPKPANKTVNPPKIVEAAKPVTKPQEQPRKANSQSTKGAEIKPFKAYDMSNIYSKFTHLKSQMSSAPVPIAPTSTVNKPIDSNDAEDLRRLEALLKIRDSSKAQAKPNQSQSNKMPQAQKVPDRNTTQKSAPNEDRSPIMSAGLSNKLKQMFDQINEFKSKAELEHIRSTRTLQRSSSIVSLPPDDSNHQNGNREYRGNQSFSPQSYGRGRSLSNSNIAGSPKGTTPKQQGTRNARGDKNDTYTPAKQRNYY